MKKVFVTGISGCVGHYLFDLLSLEPEYQLFFLVRDPSKLKFNPQNYKNLVLLKDDLKNIETYSAILKETDILIHLAADWGEVEGNYDYSQKLFKLLDPQKCEKAIYFSTASILGPDNKPSEAAEKFGTHYVRSKYRFHKNLPELKIYPKVITLFPTWVLGGDKKHPYSHASSGLLGMQNWLWLVRFFSVDASFHYIHARDLAQIVLHLLKNPAKKKEYVLGNAAITAAEFIRQTCAFYNPTIVGKSKVYFQLTIPLWLVILLAKLTGHKLHPWDLYCFRRRHFQYKVDNLENFGINSKLKTISEILATF